jgi:drug/metabolite transporter (DMT)-like permease
LVLMTQAPSRAAALAIGLFVTALWASSWVLIRIGLDEEDVGPISFAGMRYALAALVLLPLALPALGRARAWKLSPRVLGLALLYGIVQFGLAQAAQYIALDHLPAATVGLFMASAPVGTVLLTSRIRNEVADRWQVIGIGVLVAGVVAYFGLQRPSVDAIPGLAASIVMSIAVAWAAVLGRGAAVVSVAFGGIVALTALAMTAGAVVTVGTALVVEGLPPMSERAWLIVAWLAIIHTAIGFVLWNHGLRTLRAVEASALADLTVVQIALLAWVVLDERLDMLQVVGLTLAIVGVAIVQVAPTLRIRRAVSAMGTGAGGGEG